MLDVRDQSGYYSIAQAAARIGVSRVTLWRWINAGRVPAQRLGHRTARIRGEDLQRLMLPHAAVGGLPTSAPAHAVQFFDSEAFLVDAAAAYVGAALRGGHPALVVGTPAHRAAIDDRLRRAGLQLAELTAAGRYSAYDALTMLDQLVVNDRLEPERFQQTVGRLVAERAAVGGQLRVFGEMVAILASRGKHASALQLEGLWNSLNKQAPFSLLCAYPLAAFSGGHDDSLASVCDAHAHVVPTEGFMRLDTDDRRLREVTRLQQRARSLEREVERRQRAEDQLRVALAAEQTARKAAEAALKVRDEFVSIASHELKTPLTTLSGYAQLTLRRFAREGELDASRVVDAMRMIHSQADKLGRLLGHLLDVTRLDEGTLVLSRERVDLGQLVDEVVAAARAGAERHTIEVVRSGRLEAWVDALRLEQVVVNLLDNAIKYSPDGGRVEVVLRPRGRSTIELSVRDYGLGIPRKRRSSIFDRYYQAHRHAHRSGLGLGLYISRQIVELHGGRIHAQFPRGGGTRLVVRLPAAA